MSSDLDISNISSVQRLALEPKDKVWVKIDRKLSLKELDVLREQLIELFPRNSVILTYGDVDITVISEADKQT